MPVHGPPSTGGTPVQIDAEGFVTIGAHLPFKDTAVVEGGLVKVRHIIKDGNNVEREVAGRDYEE